MIYHRRGDGIISRRAPFVNQGGPLHPKIFSWASSRRGCGLHLGHFGVLREDPVRRRRLLRGFSGGAGVGQLGGDAPVSAADAGDIGLEDRPEDLLFLVPLGFIGVGAFYLLYFYTVRESTVGTAAILL